MTQLVGAALCQLGSVLGSLESGAIGPLIDMEFQQVIPLGNALTGQKHGHSETVYVEYMVSVAGEVIASGEDCNYLDHATFRWNRHDDKVRKIFDEKSKGTPVQHLDQQGPIHLTSTFLSEVLD